MKRTQRKSGPRTTEGAKEIYTTKADELKVRLKTTWMTGDYDIFSRFMEKDAERFFQRLGVKPGTKLLNVALRLPGSSP